jgi:hypothetical protein
MKQAKEEGVDPTNFERMFNARLQEKNAVKQSLAGIIDCS